MAGGLIFLLLSMSIWLAPVNASAVTWAKTYGGSGMEQGAVAAQKQGGGYVVATDALWVVSITEDGNIAWQKKYDADIGEEIHDIQTTPDGGCILTGAVGGGGALGLKLSATGTIEWQRVYKDFADSYGLSAIGTSDGGHVIAGSTGPGAPVADHRHGFLLKTDASGNILWQKTYGKDPTLVIFHSVRETSDGGFIVAATIDPHAAILKLDRNGSIIWQRILSNYIEGPRAMKQTTDGGFIIGARIKRCANREEAVYPFKLT